MDKRGNRSHHNQQDIDNNEIGEYMRINKQLSESLSTQSLEIENLKNLLMISESEKVNLQMECQTWKTKFMDIRKIYIEHICGLQTITSQLRTNFAEINITSVDGCRGGNNPKNDSRRESKSFESTKNRSGRSKVEFQDLHTIDEGDEIENSLEGTAEQKDHSDRDEHHTNVVDRSEEDANADVNNKGMKEIDVDPGIPTVVENENASENGVEMRIDEIRSRHAEVDKSSSVEQVSHFTTNCGPAIINDDSNNNNITPIDSSNSTDTINGNGHSVSNVHNGTSPFLKKLPAIKSTIKSISSEHVSIQNQTFGNKTGQSFVSSTPNRHKEASVSVSNVVVTSMEQQSSTMSVTSRPKRKAAPGSFCEPKLNTKLRRRE